MTSLRNALLVSLRMKRTRQWDEGRREEIYQKKQNSE